MKKNYYVFLIIILILNALMPLYFAFSSTTKSNIKEISYDKENYLYLSDIDYETNNDNLIAYDKTSSNKELTLKLGNEEIAFKKGIYIEGSSSIIYDLSNLEYDYFLSYVGASKSDNNVKFSIYTSLDKENWIIRNNEETSSLGNSKIKINIKDAKYLKLENKDTNNIIYADAKLVKNDYQSSISNLRTIEQYDTYLKDNYELNKTNMKEEYELAILQRELIKSVGYNNLEYIMSYDNDIKETINWLMNDLKSLRLYIMGGNPNNNRVKSLEVLSKLYTKYKSDLNDYTPTTYYNANKDSFSYLNRTYYNKTYGDLYRTMMLSLSLTHADTVSSWLDSDFLSDAVNRYEIYKKLYLSNRLENQIFESLTVEEMRLVMNNAISDEEIEWLNYYTKSNSNNPYDYLNYQPNYNYYNKKYYDKTSNSYKNFDNKYNLTSYNISNELNKPKLWMAFEEGGTAGAISLTGTNINNSWGIPASVISEPGHVSYLTYNLNADGKGYWTIKNGVSNWSKAGRTGYLANRMLNSWGEYDYATYNNNVRPGSYIILAEDALNEYDKYEKSKELVLLADVFVNENERQYDLYNKSLEILNINFDAWKGIIDLYRKNSETESNWYNLALKISEALGNYPLPMHDLLKQIGENITSSEYTLKYANLHEQSLSRSLNSENASVKDVASALLENFDKKIAIFSFDGVSGGSILLRDNIINQNNSWEYSLDNGNTWILVDGNQKKLDTNELNNLNADSGIKIHLVNTEYNDENIYKIKLVKTEEPKDLYANDLENAVIGINSKMEWRYVNTDTWTSYIDDTPDLNGNKSIEIRYKATGTNLPSLAVTYNFTENNNEVTKKYIPISNLSIEKVSSEATSDGGAAINAIDGNINTIWHSNMNGQDTNRYIIIKLKEPVALSALEYIPSSKTNNGRIKTGIISVSTDGTNFREIKNVSWSDDTNSKKEEFTPTEAMYVKIEATSNYGDGRSFINAAMFNLYRDASNDKAPTASIYYNHTELTNENVTVKLINPSTNITITNNNGSDTYTFNKNGEFTFEFTDEFGVKGRTTAIVDWIDKTVPTASIEYSVNSLTNKEVVATLTNLSEEVTILNNYLEEGNAENGNNTYTFSANGEFTFRYQDKAGNIGTTRAFVNWIDKEPTIGEITYTLTEDKKGIIATLKSTDSIVILNNNGSNTHTFNKNDTFSFMYQDIAGNVLISEAKVDDFDKTINEIMNNKPSLSYINNSNERINDTNNSLNNKNINNSSYVNITNIETVETHNYMFLYMIIFVIDLFLSTMFIYFIIEQMKEEKEISLK